MDDHSEHGKRFIRLINGDSISEDRIGAAFISDSVEVGSGPVGDIWISKRDVGRGKSRGE